MTTMMELQTRLGVLGVKASFPTIRSGTYVSWPYRGTEGHGIIRGIYKLGTKPANTEYSIEEFDHHVSTAGSKEKNIVHHYGRVLTTYKTKPASWDKPSAKTETGTETKIRKVATDEGVARYHLPKGSVIGSGKPDFPVKHVYIHHSSKPGDDSQIVRYVGNGNRQHLRSFPDAESANAHMDSVEDEQLGEGEILPHTFHVINGRIHRISSGEVFTEQPNGRQEHTGVIDFNAAGHPVVKRKVATKGNGKYEVRGKSFPTVRDALLHLAGDPGATDSYEFEGKRVPLHQSMESEISKHMRPLRDDEPRVTPDGQPIPPAVKNVEVAIDPGFSTQYRGVNDLGNVVSLPSKSAVESGDEAKHARVKEVAKNIHKLDAALTPQQLRDNPTAAAVYIMRHGGSRVDSGGNKRNTVKGHQTFGASTIQAKHVTIRGNTTTVQFPGKDNVLNTYKFRDPDFATAMANHLRGKRGNDRVFDGVTSAKTQKYIQRHLGVKNAKNHDLRTHLATSMAADMIRNTGPRQLPKTEREYTKQRRAIGEAVANQLNNKPLQALNKYIDPSVFVPLRANIQDEPAKPPVKKTIRKKK